jgi:hypothetical protein
MVTSAGGLVDSFCYDYTTANGFATAFDAVLTSVTAADKYSATIAGVYTALDKINTCQFTGMVCGQSPFTYDGNSIDQTAGIVSPASEQTYCNFVVKEGSSECSRYVCSSVAGGSILDANIKLPSDARGIDRSSIGSLSLEVAATDVPITDLNLSWTAKVGSSYIVAYGSAAYVSKAATVNTSFGAISVTESVGTFVGDDVTFSALTSTGRFVVYAEDAPASSCSGDECNTGGGDGGDGGDGGGEGTILEVKADSDGMPVIIGAVVGSVVALILIGLVGYFVTKKKGGSRGGGAGQAGNPHEMIRADESADTADYSPVQN